MLLGHSLALLLWGAGRGPVKVGQKGFRVTHEAVAALGSGKHLHTPRKDPGRARKGPFPSTPFWREKSSTQASKLKRAPESRRIASYTTYLLVRGYSVKEGSIFSRFWPLTGSSHPLAAWAAGGWVPSPVKHTSDTIRHRITRNCDDGSVSFCERRVCPDGLMVSRALVKTGTLLYSKEWSSRGVISCLFVQVGQPAMSRKVEVVVCPGPTFLGPTKPGRSGQAAGREEKQVSQCRMNCPAWLVLSNACPTKPAVGNHRLHVDVSHRRPGQEGEGLRRGVQEGRERGERRTMRRRISSGCGSR